MKKFFLIFFVFSKIFSCQLDVDISAKNAILINAVTGKVLFEKNGLQKVYPASLTKVLTIYYVIDEFESELDRTFIASKNAIKVVKPETKINSNYRLAPHVLETDGSHFDLQVSENISLRHLLHGMVISSGNDAANVIAENISGSIESFIENLNKFLIKKGCKNTCLCNPHGLHIPEHISTAYDLAHIASLAIKNQKFLEIFSCKYYIRPNTNKQQKKEIITYNKLLKPGKNYYPYAIASKTGYHAKAKYNLLSLAKKNDRKLIAVVMGCKSNDVRYEDTIKLFNKAFEETKVNKKVLSKDKMFLAKITGGSSVLKTSLKEDFNIYIYPSEDGLFTANIYWNNIKAPIRKNKKVATIIVKDSDGNFIKKQSLYAKNNVRRSFFFVLKELFVKS